MKKFSILLLIVALAFIQFCSAHSGSQSWLKINGKITITNPYFYSQNTDFQTGQDNIDQNFLVSEKVNFEVDLSIFASGAPVEARDQIEFRWSTTKIVDGKKSDYKTGSKTDFTFVSTGTYLVTTEFRNSPDATYNIVDTINVNIVPSKNYKTPIQKTDIQQKDKNEILYRDRSEFDPSSKNNKILWKENDDQVVEADIFNFKAENELDLLYQRIIDQNNIVNDTFYRILNTQTEQKIIDPATNTTANSTLSSKANVGTQKTDSDFLLVSSIIIVAAIAIAGTYLFYKRK